MRELRDPEKIEYYLEKYEVRSLFDTPGLQFQGLIYDKGELIVSPVTPLEDLLFLVEGTVRIYGIRENDSLQPIGQSGPLTLLGDVEYASGRGTPFFVETTENSICLSLKMSEYSERLDRDIKFLHLMLSSCTKKLDLYAMDDAAQTVERRLLFYMEYSCQDKTLRGVERAAFQLRCSRRQLQRTLKKLCEQGKIIHMGKGSYRLAK